MLLTHPAVAEAVCFGVPHATWGEEVAAAVVLREGEPATEADLLAFCKERLADFKRPKQIHITEAIPRTATGKIQRGVVAKAFAGLKRADEDRHRGAGAIGGYIGARLAQAGADVVLFARGPHLRAMQERGLRVISPDGDFEVRPQVTGDLATIGHGRRRLSRRQGARPDGAGADSCGRSSGPTPSSSARRTGSRGGTSRATAASWTGCGSSASIPAASIAAAIEPRRVVGSLAYFATDIVEPGVIRHTEGNRISFGEPDGTESERARAIAEPLIAAGFRCPVTTRFRHEIWVKLLGNVAFNPISALTRGTLEELARASGRVARRARR